MDNVLDLIKDKATAAVSFTDIETAVVKACSRQLIAPKPKHIKTLLIHCNNRIAPMSDIFKTLDSVLKEPHWAVVFKALITIHVLSRDACGDRILGYIAAQPNILNLSGFKDKTNTPAGVEQAKNIRSYASYLEEKVASFRDLKCDYCRDSGDLARALHAKSPGSELFRHTKTLVRLSNSLLSCKFYLDELDNPITMDAFRYLLRDLMAIYRALAKGCLKLLETYFDMSKGDATEALEIYQSYAQVNEKVIDFFKIAKRVESALSSDIPDITPTPASLTDTLKQYLDNYEENHRTNNSSSNQGNNSQSNQKTQAERVSISANTNNLNNNNNNNNLLDLFDVSSTSGNNANSNNYNNQAIVSNAFDPFQVSNNRNFGSFSGPQGISAGNKDPFAITAAGQSQAPFSSSAMMSNSFSNPFQQQQMQQPIQHQMQQQIQQPIQQQMHQPIQHQIHQQMQQPMQQYNFQKQTSYQQPNPFQSQHNPTVIPPSSYNSMGSSFSTTAPLPVTQVQPRNIQTDAFGDLFQQQGQNNQGFAKPFYQPQPQFNNNNVNPFTNSIQPNATNFGGSSNPFTSTSVAQPFPSNPIRNNNANTSNSNNRNNANPFM